MIEITNKQWPQLFYLNLERNKISASGVKQLLQMNAVKLLCINLSHNNIGSMGSKWLTKINLPLLQKIQLKNCNIGNQGMKHLMKANWKQLQVLDLIFNEIGCDGFSNLNEYIWNIYRLYIFGSFDKKHYFQGISLLSIVTIKTRKLIFYIPIDKQNIEKPFITLLSNRRIVRQVAKY